MDFVDDHRTVVLAAVACAVAVVAWWGDRRRRHRSDLDRVGLVPWTTLSFWATAVAVMLLISALEDWLASR